MTQRNIDDIKTSLVMNWVNNMSLEELRDYYIDGSHDFLDEYSDGDIIEWAVRYGVDTDITETTETTE